MRFFQSEFHFNKRYYIGARAKNRAFCSCNMDTFTEFSVFGQTFFVPCDILWLFLYNFLLPNKHSSPKSNNAGIGGLMMDQLGIAKCLSFTKMPVLRAELSLKNFRKYTRDFTSNLYRSWRYKGETKHFRKEGKINLVSRTMAGAYVFLSSFVRAFSHKFASNDQTFVVIFGSFAKILIELVVKFVSIK